MSYNIVKPGGILKNIAGGTGSEVPVFTQAEWNDLTTEEKLSYAGKQVIISDDYDESSEGKIPVYTSEEYEQKKDTIPVGTNFIISDDYSGVDVNKVTSFKLSTWNVHEFMVYSRRDLDEDSDENITPFVEYLNSLEGDVLCTQEDRIYLYATDLDTDNTVTKRIYSHWFKNSYINSSKSNRKKTHARRISTNYPLYNTGYIEYNGYQIAVYGTICIDGKEILIVNVHLTYVGGTPPVEQKKNETDALQEKIKSLGYEYIVVCGDFNPVDSYEYDNWWKDDEWNKANSDILGTFNTFNNGTAGEPNDNVITTKNIKIGNVKYTPNEFKDHIAISVKLTLS